MNPESTHSPVSQQPEPEQGRGAPAARPKASTAEGKAASQGKEDKAVKAAAKRVAGGKASKGGKHAASATAETQQAKDGGRIIKKYPNRRLYDMASSTYITLADVKQFVMQHEPVIVQDAKTGEDLTRSILLQIILEEEVAGSPFFSEAMLANLIRFYGHAMQGFMGAYIEKNIQMMSELQSQWVDQTRHLPPEFWGQFSASGVKPGIIPNMVGAYGDQGNQLFGQMQEQIQEQINRQTQQMLALFGMKPR